MHYSDCAALLRRQAATSSVLIVGLILVSAASAVDLDFDAADGISVNTMWAATELIV
jgi:hypothetical protein